MLRQRAFERPLVAHSQWETSTGHSTGLSFIPPHPLAHRSLGLQAQETHQGALGLGAPNSLVSLRFSTSPHSVGVREFRERTHYMQ